MWCYGCGTFNLRSKCIQPHWFNASTIFPLGFCQVTLNNLVRHMLQPWGVVFDQLLIAYIPVTHLAYQLVDILILTGSFILFHCHSMLLSLVRSDLRLLRRRLCLHYQITAPVLYGVHIILEEVKMVILYSMCDLLSSCYTLHESVCFYRPMWDSIKLGFFTRRTELIQYLLCCTFQMYYCW